MWYKVTIVQNETVEPVAEFLSVYRAMAYGLWLSSTDPDINVMVSDLTGRLQTVLYVNGKEVK